MANIEETCAVHVDDISQADLILSDKKIKTWRWLEDGASKSRNQTYAEVYYKKKGTKLIFTFGDVRTIRGIQTSVKFKSGFMSVKLPLGKTEQLRRLDDLMFKLAFEHRVAMMKKGGKIDHPSQMRLLFQGLVKDGDEKDDGGKWDDQITCTVPTKRKGQQVIIDDNECVVEDLDGKPYSWTALDGKTIKELAIEVDRMVFDNKGITVRGLFRLIVPDDRTRARVTTKRKLEQTKTVYSAPDEEDTSPDPTKKSAIEPPASQPVKKKQKK